MDHETRSAIRPTEVAPELDLPLVGGGRLLLAERRPQRFTMLVFNRGLHCPNCRAQLAELDRRIDELTERGIEVVSVSGESAERATAMRDDWGIANVPLAYGLSESQMRAWASSSPAAATRGSRRSSIEPAVFLLKPDHSVYYEAILSMPAGRPHLDDLLHGIDYWTANDYPARGEA